MKQEDYTTRDGCAKLRAAVQNYWAAKLGLEAQPISFLMPYTACGVDEEGSTIIKNRFDLRSDMVNGMPRGCVFKGGKFVHEAATSDKRLLGANDAKPTRRVRAATQSQAMEAKR